MTRVHLTGGVAICAGLFLSGVWVGPGPRLLRPEVAAQTRGSVAWRAQHRDRFAGQHLYDYTTETYEGKRIQKFTYQGVGPITKQYQGTPWPASAR